MSELLKVNKRELIDERRHGLAINIYWLTLTNEIGMCLVNEKQVREFIIPNDSVLDARDHPEMYAIEAGLYGIEDHESIALRSVGDGSLRR